LSTVSRFQPEMTTNAARLRVELPHWAADVHLFDDLSQPVHDVPPLRAESGGRYVTEIDVPAGIYDLEVTFLGKTFRDEISLSVGRPHTWTPPDWSQLTAPSGLKTTHEQIEEMVRSKKRTWQEAQGDSQLRLSICMIDKEGKPAPIRPMRLCQFDENGNETLITDLTNTSERPAEGQIAFGAHLPSGHYVMKSQTPEGSFWCRPVYLAAGWSTNIAISVDRSPTGQRLVSLCMSERDRESPADSSVDVAYLAVLDALTRGTETQFITKEHIHALTTREDPWLAVLASYALLPGIESEPFRARRGADRDSGGLFRELRQFAASRLPDHPDVRALELSSESMSAPFPHPPLLLAALRRAQVHAAKWRGTIPPDSLTDRLLDEVAPGAPWTTWIEGGQRSPELARDRTIERPKFLQNVSPKAPVFRIRGLPGRTRSGTPNLESSHRPTDARDTLRDARIVDLVTRTVYGEGVDRPLPDLDVDMNSEISEFLTVDAHAVSVATNIPIDRVEQALASLRAAATLSDEPREPAPLGPVEQQLVAFAIGDKAFAPQTPGAAPAITIEDVLLKLKGVTRR
jgi:hypothetical protein